MGLLRILKIPNGDMRVDYKIYECDICRSSIEEAWPHYNDGNLVYCNECAFRKGIITSQKYLNNSGIHITCEAGINPENGHIEIVLVNKTGKRSKFTWEKTNKQLRFTPQYAAWRDSVYRRDNFTCQMCLKHGGDINAHHIKSYSKHKGLRYKIENGITLCTNCHRAVHKGAMACTRK